MSNNISEWEELVAKIREWDRAEHVWATSDKSVVHKNIKTKSSLINYLMSEFELKKK